MKKTRSIPAAIAAGVLTVAAGAVWMTPATASDTSTEPGTSSIEPAYYWVDLASAATPTQVAEAAAALDLVITSVRHGGDGETAGELVLGDSGIADAMRMYTDTNVEQFGEVPHVTSFVTTTNLDGIALDVVLPGAVAAAFNRPSLQPLNPQEPDSTTDSEATSDGEVGTGSVDVSNAKWAPASGRLRGFNATTGFKRRVVHNRLLWKSRAGLDSYQGPDGDFVYEHDHKLIDRDPYSYGAMSNRFCTEAFWADAGSAEFVSSDSLPGGSDPYVDTANASDPCGTSDISFGIFKPEKLQTGKYYRVVLGMNPGAAARSYHQLKGQKLGYQCPGDRSQKWCVSPIGDPDGEDHSVNIASGKDFKLPGCYLWYHQDGPTATRC